MGSLEPTVNLVSFSFVDGVRVASLLPRLLDRELVPSAKKKTVNSKLHVHRYPSFYKKKKMTGKIEMDTKWKLSLLPKFVHLSIT